MLVAHYDHYNAPQVRLRDVQGLIVGILAEHDDLVLVNIMVRQDHLEILDALHAVSTLDSVQLRVLANEALVTEFAHRNLLVEPIIEHLDTGLLLQLVNYFEPFAL